MTTTNGSKNKEIMDDFLAYCIDHPEERFWQALRNWSGYHFVFVGNLEVKLPEGLHESHPFTVDQAKVLAESLDLHDTFYWEDRGKNYGANKS